MRRIAPAAAALAVALIFPGLRQSAAADSSASSIARARALVAESAETLDAARSGVARLDALGRAVTAHEAALAALRAGMRDLAAAERVAAAGLLARAEPLGRLLTALQSIARAPDSALLAVRGGPVEVHRAALLMAAVTPELDRRVAELDRDLETLRALRRSQAEVQAGAREALAGLQELRAATAAAMGRRDRSGLSSRAELAAAARVAAEGAHDLAGLARGLRAAGLAGPAEFAGEKGKLPLPVAGRLAARFGANDPWGRPGRGWTIEAAAFAQVTAPFDATIRYAGPLIDYGQVVVLEPAADYLVVLAGLARTDRQTGETVLTGERLGDLGGELPTSAQFLLDAAAEDGQIKRKALYVEIRRSGEPQDPAEWFDLTGSEAIQ